MFTIQGKRITVTADEKKAVFTITLAGGQVWTMQGRPYVELTDGSVYYLDEAQCQATERKTGTWHGYGADYTKETYDALKAAYNTAKEDVKSNDYDKITAAAKVTRNLGYGEEDGDERYAETIRIAYGAERALAVYSSSVYKKMQEIHESSGIDYEILYTYYFATRGITADKDASGNSISGSKKQKILRIINSLGITRKQKVALARASGYEMN